MSDYTTTGARFERLVDIMRILRAPDGCPWDREQTLQTLRPFVLEETYEVLEAIDSGDPDQLREELGDFLFEAVFLGQLSEEAGDFSIGDAIDAVCDKLIRRHPHVFEREGDGDGLAAFGEQHQLEIPVVRALGIGDRKHESCTAIEKPEPQEVSAHESPPAV